MSRDATNSGLRRRVKNTADVLLRCREIDETEDGYILSYPRTDAWSERLDAFVEAWRKSCPQMSFEIGVGAESGSLSLEISGPDGTKQFVEGARYMLSSHLNPAPSFANKLRQGLRYVTSPTRALPDYLIIGAKKCGTTALYSYMTQHASIVPAFRKEIYYFNTLFGRSLHWYRAFFPTAMEKQRIQRDTGRPTLTGEATPDYLFDFHAPRRAFATVPQARLIAILRNPVDRAYSFYNHNLRAGLEELSFEQAIDREQERLEGQQERLRADETRFSFAWEHYSYATRGVYVDQLREWTGCFPESQILVLRTEDLHEQPEQTLRLAFDFLGLPYSAPKQFRKLNAAPPYPDMEPPVREKLEAYFAPHNLRLSEFLGTRMDW